MNWLEIAILALGLVLAVEGLVYAAFPNAVKRFMAVALDLPAETLRTGGLVAVVAGLALIALAGALG